MPLESQLHALMHPMYTSFCPHYQKGKRACRPDLTVYMLADPASDEPRVRALPSAFSQQKLSRIAQPIGLAAEGGSMESLQEALAKAVLELAAELRKTG